MSTEPLWSRPQRIARLSQSPFGRQLAIRVAEQLVRDNGDDGIWNRHRDYCGHGLLYRENNFQLVSLHDGSVSDTKTIKSWADTESFVDWLARQSNFSLSGADPTDPDLHTTNASTLNNQRITQSRLVAYVARRNTQPIFRVFRNAVLEEFAFLADDYEFELSPPEQTGREYTVSYHKPHVEISVTAEMGQAPLITITVKKAAKYELLNHPIDRLLRQRVGDWVRPEFRSDENQQNYRSYLRAYAHVLQLNLRDLLVTEDAEENNVPPPTGGLTARSVAAVVATIAVVVMVAELRYFSANGTPDATGSVRGNVGIMLLMGAPWVVFTLAALQFATGIDIRRFNSQFNHLPLLRKLAISGAAVLSTITATALAAWIA